MMRVRLGLALLPLLTAVFLAQPDAAVAQKYPSRPIRVMLPFAAGSVRTLERRVCP